MTIDKNIRYYGSIAEKLRGITTELLISQLPVALSYRTLFWIDAKTHSCHPLVQRESHIKLIFMIIKENIRNHRKIAEKLKEYSYKITNITASNCQREATWY